MAVSPRQNDRTTNTRHWASRCFMFVASGEANLEKLIGLQFGPAKGQVYVTTDSACFARVRSIIRLVLRMIYPGKVGSTSKKLPGAGAFQDDPSPYQCP